MKLFTLIEAHRSFASEAGALKDSFGDGYLLNKNHFFSRIRKASLAAGFRFSPRIDDSYLALSLSQLDSIMAKKEIPYFNNVSVLESLEAKIPKLTTWDDISDNLKGNHVFHEACHAVAKTFTRNLSKSLQAESVENKVLLMLLEESFANTCELLSIIDANDQIHRVFIELNSYVYMMDDRANLINAVKDMGAPTIIRFMLLSYLHANFLRPPDEKDFERCFALSAGGKTLDTKNKKTLRALSKIAFKLNPRFREVTTRFHLKLNGINKDVASLGGFDFLRALEKNDSRDGFLNGAGSLLD